MLFDLEIQVDFCVNISPPGGSVATKREHRTEDRDQDQRQHDGVFDCGRGVFVPKELQDFSHLARLISTLLLETAVKD